MEYNYLPSDLAKQLSDAVSAFWRTRRRQTDKQKASGQPDQGARAAVTGGAQMNGFTSLIRGLVSSAKIPDSCVFTNTKLQLPGYFRPTKEWDIVVVVNGQLILAIEVKSHVGSFGNNFNNRTEEAMGSSLDLWTAFREGAYNSTIRPWLGYLMLLEDSPKSRGPVKTMEPHFKVFPEFVGASYARRYELFCRRLVRERKYDAACFMMSPGVNGQEGIYSEPAEDLTFGVFAKALIAHASAYAP
jgi:hypothetical protein